MTKQLEAQYYEDGTGEFWDRVNALPSLQRDRMIAAGELLAMAEATVLMWLEAAEMEADKKGER